jgi:hypothetical protein
MHVTHIRVTVLPLETVMRWFLLFAMACSGSGVDGTSEATETPSSILPSATTPDPATGTSSTTSTTPVTTATTSESVDEAWVRELVAGSRSVEEVIPAVAWSGGWPVQTSSGTQLFVAWTDEATSVAGDFNDWVPESMRAGSGFQWLEVEIADGAGLGYKLVDGSGYHADPWARSYMHDAYGELSYVDPPTDRYRLDRWPGFAAAGLVPRDVRIYVPAGDGPWPTLYMADGQNLFDPGAFWGGWRLTDALAATGEALVVGVDNTTERMDEYTHVPDDIGYGYPIGGEADAMAELVAVDLRAHVEAIYGEPSKRGLLGSSLGGLLSLHIAHRYPDTFDFAGSLSGTLGWGRFVLEEPVMEELYVASGLRSTALYLDSGGGAGPDGLCQDLDGDGFVEDDPDDADNYCTTRSFADAMVGAGYTWDVNLWHWHEADAPHNEMAWADRVHRPIELFLSL